ncbi:hypothetical protein XENTR_v10013466 [Xenopus tropicalis]|nr:hypothetical protein XENTR_v10013466 [Xenopus tropicalis]
MLTCDPNSLTAGALCLFNINQYLVRVGTSIYASGLALSLMRPTLINAFRHVPNTIHYVCIILYKTQAWNCGKTTMTRLLGSCRGGQQASNPGLGLGFG